MPLCGRDEYEAWDDAADESDAEDETSWSEADEEDADTVTVPCPKCGREIPDFADRCPYCGNWVMQGGAPPRRAWWIVPIALLVALGVLLWAVQ